MHVKCLNVKIKKQKKIAQNKVLKKRAQIKNGFVEEMCLRCRIKKL